MVLLVAKGPGKSLRAASISLLLRPAFHCDVAGHQNHLYRYCLHGAQRLRHRSSTDRLPCCRRSYWVHFAETVVAAVDIRLVAEERVDLAAAGSHLALEEGRGYSSFVQEFAFKLV
jgi:hypothetical protein